MTEARVVVDAKALRSGGMGPATGSVWLMLGVSAFPLTDWHDFVVVILEAWVSSIVRLLRGFSDRELVHFMDGPYAVEVSTVAPGTVRLRAIKHGRYEVAQVDAKAVPLVESLLAASESILVACRAQNCWSTDADKLSANLPVLRREVMRLRSDAL